MAKTCCICNKKMGMMTGKVKLSDGYVCADCWKKTGFNSFSDLKSALYYSSLTILKIINERKENQLKIMEFDATRKVGNILEFSDETKTFVIATRNVLKTSEELFKYSQILNFELLEDGTSIIKGGLGGAIVGGIVLGRVGAVVGGVTSGKKIKGICNSLKIKITFKNSPRPNIYINFIKTKTMKNGIIYKTQFKLAQDALSALQIAFDQVQENTNENLISEADELIKFKKLFDEGVITQDEFEAKKKQILKL